MSKREMNIKVTVRVRPKIKEEAGRIAIKWGRKEIRAKDKICRFDHVFGPEASQLDVYLATLNPMIKDLVNGYNCTVLTYGQTGSGKTYTISGDIGMNKMPPYIHHWKEDNEAGIIPRAALQIFDVLSATETNYTVKVSYLELYNEEIRDLLSDTIVLQNLMVYVDPHIKGNVYIKGLKEVTVYCKDDVIAQWQTGLKKRQTAMTQMNIQSSRSHAVFIITVVTREKLTNSTDIIRTAKLNIVDLAGSENIAKAGVKDMRAVELANINKSLLTLGRVINLLVENASHIPYRESKLTRILQDSLGGNSYTCMIANVSPTSTCLDETISTLEYALRARKITNCPEANRQTTRDEMSDMFNEEMARLQREIEVLRGNKAEGFFIDRNNYQEMRKTIESCNQVIIDKHERIRELQQKCRELEELHLLKLEEWELMQVELDKHKSLLEKYRAKHKEQKALIKQERYVRQVLEERDQQMSGIADELMDYTKRLSENEDKLHGKVNQLYSISKQYEQVTRESMNVINEHLSDISQVSKRISHSAITTIIDDIQPQLKQAQKQANQINQQVNDSQNHLMNFFISSEQLLTGAASAAFDSVKLYAEQEAQNKQIKINQLDSLTNQLTTVRSDLNERIKEDETQLALMQQMMEIITKRLEKSKDQLSTISNIEKLIEQLQVHEANQIKLEDIHGIAETFAQLHSHIMELKDVPRENVQEIIDNLHSSIKTVIVSIDKIISKNNDHLKELKDIHDSNYDSLKECVNEKFQTMFQQLNEQIKSIEERHQLVFLKEIRSDVNKIQEAITEIDNVIRNECLTVVKPISRAGDTPLKVNVQVPKDIHRTPTNILMDKIKSNIDLNISDVSELDDLDFDKENK